MASRPPYVKVTPELPSPHDDANRAEQEKLLKEAWAAWDEAAAAAPVCRRRIAEYDAILPQLQRNLEDADLAVERARGDYIVNSVIGPGGAVLTDAGGRPLVMIDEQEEDRDPGVVLAKAKRAEAEQALKAAQARKAQCGAIISRAEHQRPVGPRPRD